MNWIISLNVFLWVICIIVFAQDVRGVRTSMVDWFFKLLLNKKDKELFDKLYLMKWDFVKEISYVDLRKKVVNGSFSFYSQDKSIFVSASGSINIKAKDDFKWIFYKQNENDIQRLLSFENGKHSVLELVFRKKLIKELKLIIKEKKDEDKIAYLKKEEEKMDAILNLPVFKKESVRAKLEKL